MPSQSQTVNEVDFCSQIASAVKGLIANNPTRFPFHDVRVEGYGTGTGRRKRKDLRFFDSNGAVNLCGEVKLPGTPEGRSAFSDELMQDAFNKADNAGVRYFFTWNVNEFVLFDRQLWDNPLIDRRIRLWRLARNLSDPAAVAREENLDFIKSRFLPNLLHDLADILAGRQRDWLPPDDIFIRSLESHLDWPVKLIARHVLQNVDRNRTFALRVGQWMSDQEWTVLRTPHEEWARLVDNMAKTLAYVWANRLIFYKALRARFPELPRLELRPAVKTSNAAVAAFNQLFRRAVERSGDYEPLLMPEAADWATELVFQPADSLDAWRGLLRGIESVDFRAVPSDVVGRIFQKLIGPEERHRYGQHFTGDDAVDLINAFCIRDASDTILDPACGSGSFLVRAYYRKRHLDPGRPHLDVLGELFGCDIAQYPAHLATLNLAAREINDEANYPRVARRNFFDFEPPEPFCKIPDGNGQVHGIALPVLDGIVGNPPYVRQEKIIKEDKTRFGALVTAAWPGLRLGGRSDLHCYFWPAAARLLKADGYFGFLTSSSWLDVEYGFALQGWVLRHFRILAILESADEPWFTDARVKTCITILQRCANERSRMSNHVRFVQFRRKLAEIIDTPPGEDEAARQAAIEALRNRILSAQSDYQDDDLRIIVKAQGDLWTDGVRAGSILRGGTATGSESDDEDVDDGEVGETPAERMFDDHSTEYAAGKWGRFVRAPDLYFEIMSRFGNHFVMLGEIAAIRYGVKTGCDAFFTPRDVSDGMLIQYPAEREFRQHCGGAPRKDVESGKLRIIQDGAGVMHPIEARSIAREVHSVMGIRRPSISAREVDRVVLLVSAPLDTLKAKAPWTYRYLQYGAAATFPSRKSKPVPVPRRSFISKRSLWYKLTDQVKPGIAIWPKGQQYRHLVIANPDRLVANCRLYDVAVRSPDLDPLVVVAVLNSTLVALWRNFYGRYTGTEGAMETMVVDVLMTEIPNPAFASRRVAARLRRAFHALCQRDTGDFIEEQLMDCHSPDRARRIAAGPVALSTELRQSDRRELDDAVFELLGVGDAAERNQLIDRLYEATAQHFRAIRVVEIQKMQERARADTRRFGVQDQAADIWDAAELEDATPLVEWIARRPELQPAVEVDIPEERPATVDAGAMFDATTVYFGRSRRSHIECPSAAQAELIVRLAELGLAGKVALPTATAPAVKLLARLNERVEHASGRFRTLAESRTSDDRAREQLMEVLLRWFVVGRENRTQPEAAEE
jgi:methylase of polypeptide subunit release factors